MGTDQRQVEPLRLKIEGVIQAASKIQQRIQTDLSTHNGLTGACEHVIAAAQSAERVSKSVRRWYSPHRLPAIFLAVAIALLGVWIYWRFFYVSRLTVAIPDRDATELREKLNTKSRIQLKPVAIPGSREAAELVSQGKVDLAFVQGGVPLRPELRRLETPDPEFILWMTKNPTAEPASVTNILTSAEGEGSHTVAKDIVSIWGVEKTVRFVHQWQELTERPQYQVPPEVDGVMVVKDLSDPKTLDGVAKLVEQGFHLRNLGLGVQAEELEYLHEAEIEPGYLSASPALPETSIETYRVPTYLVARDGLTPRLLGIAAHIFDTKPASIAEGEFDPISKDASELFQGIDAFLGIIVNIVLAFLALLGLEMMTYRKRFHELNSLVSLLSMLQSNKDILGVSDDAKRNENLQYLGTVSDMLVLVSAISGYYTQENSSLLFNNLSEVIHERCDNLKLNIQLKILHATIDLEKLKGKGSEIATVRPRRNRASMQP